MIVDHHLREGFYIVTLRLGAQGLRGFDLPHIAGAGLGDIARRVGWRCGRSCGRGRFHRGIGGRSEEHTSELQSLMRISYAVFCLKKKNTLKDILYMTRLYPAYH